VVIRLNIAGVLDRYAQKVF